MTTRTTADEFLTKVRRCLGRTAPLASPPVPPMVTEELTRLNHRGEPYVELFATRAAGAGMQVVRVKAAELESAVLKILQEIPAKRITAALPRLVQGPSLLAAIQNAGIGLAEWKNDRTMAAHFDADAGISDVAAALADSGSLVCCSDAQHGRGHSLVVPIHIAIVRSSDVVPDMLDYLATVEGVSPRDLPSAQAIITGPSKTADIEGILVTGIHGPFKVHVLLVEDQ